MADRRTPSYPGVGEPDRLDAIVRRGRTLRRRRQLLAAGAGAGSAAVIVALVLVFTGGGGADPVSTDTAEGGNETTTTEAPAPDELVVRVLDGAPARIQIDDPEQPEAETTQQCLYVRLRPASSTDPTDPAVAEGTACAPGLSADGQAELALVLTNGVEIGCAVSISNPGPEGVDGTETRRGATTFEVQAPDLAPGEYQADIGGSSGIGDGCPPPTEQFERERTVELTTTITLP
jgi:hypothetical protein